MSHCSKAQTHELGDLTAPTGSAKALGAYYTDSQVADFLVWWAIRSASDAVMDPSFGGGVFLRSACKRLLALGGDAKEQVWGVEIDPQVHERIAGKINQEFGVRTRHLLCADFFEVEKGTVPPMAAVVGNPPFIRYHRFTGEARQRALARAASEGVTLSSLTSSWAPFLVHAIGSVRTGGRLAMVLPFEVAYASYALPVLEHLRRAFARLTFITFRRKLFPDLSEDTLLLLGENKGQGPGVFLLRDLPHPGKLAEMLIAHQLPLPGVRRVDGEALAHGRERFTEYLMPKRARDLYRRLQREAPVTRLGNVARVGIGYVTGANDFFHLSPDEVRRRRIPMRFLRPAVRRGRALGGVRFTEMDWREAALKGEAGYLLSLKAVDDLPQSVRDYLAEGEEKGVPRTYKCRTRSPWFCVPNVYLPDAFLSYMSGVSSRLVANPAEAVAPNSLHVLRLYPEAGLTGDALAVLWQSSLTQLSAEVEGHSLGGGMLKIEPGEAEKIVLASVSESKAEFPAVADNIDLLVRQGRDSDARALADRLILRDHLGLSRAECRSLEAAVDTLRNRRYGRGATR